MNQLQSLIAHHYHASHLSHLKGIMLTISLHL